jgi:hypothetical protein
MTVYETWTRGEERVTILYDEDAENPREWYSDRSTLVTKHRRYKLGDREPLSDTEYDERCADDTLVVLPVYLYDHSGLALSTGPFACPWDSGMIGFVFEKIEANETHEIVEKRLIDDIKLYSKFLQGIVFYFKREIKKTCATCEHVTWEHVDSCGGYIGSPNESNLYEDAFPEGKDGWELST